MKYIYKLLRVAGLALLAIFLLQNHLLFPRYITGGVINPKTADAEIQAQGFTRYENSGILSPNFFASAKGTVVVLHGNGGWALQRTYISDALTRLGYRVFLYEYPGYGWRKGSPHSKDVVPEVSDILSAMRGKFKEPIILWGESVGSGFASQVAAHSPDNVDGLVLTLPWSSLQDVIRKRYVIPLDYISLEKMDSVEALQHIKCPIVIGYAEKDKTIAPQLSKKLYYSIPNRNKLLIEFKNADHNTYPIGSNEKWWKEAISFIEVKQPSI